MFRCFECYLTETEPDTISLAFFDQVPLFSDFNRLFELLGQDFVPCSSNAFYILEQSSKNILKTLIANFMDNFHVPADSQHIYSLAEEKNFQPITFGQVSPPLAKKWPKMGFSMPFTNSLLIRFN